MAAVFGVGQTTVHRYLHLFVKAICKKRSKYIKWYSPLEAAILADETKQRYGYPQAIGAIDGTHIPVTAPEDGKSDYICRKGYPSIVLQAVADCRYTFRDVYANTPGATHDASVYRRSPLSHFISTNMPVRNNEIAGVDVPLHILGDPAYPLSDLIIKGYPGRNLTAEEDSFNVYLSSSRMCIEIAFGKLKSRWRMLQKKLDVETSTVPYIVVACCILHNMCESFRMPMPAPNADDECNRHAYPQPATAVNQHVDNPRAHAIRDAIKQYLAVTQPLRKSFHS